MKKIFGISFSGLFLFLFFIQMGTVSCTKDKTIYDTITVNKRDTIAIKDTIVIKDTAITLQLLTANTWKIEELRGVINNTPYYYLRGGSNNTNNYDNESITFRQDKTGIYVDPNGYSSSLTWDFASADNTKIVYTVNFPTVITTVNWEHVRYKNSLLLYDEYYSQNNNVFSHSHGVRSSTGK